MIHTHIYIRVSYRFHTFLICAQSCSMIFDSHLCMVALSGMACQQLRATFHAGRTFTHCTLHIFMQIHAPVPKPDVKRVHCR